ncbi:MAG: hypothetical protein XXXJIFNMEKO3_00719 [Candidatus Erwinia impunctatus]|nr:hypothetical protein XXXJIFNMEKO_00719 [Culicoides impunctatus]
MNGQRGGASLTAVVLLLLLATGLLHAFQQQAMGSLHLVADEKHYIQQALMADSALAWATRVEWREIVSGWRCQTERESGLRACISQPYPERILLRGDTGEGTLAHYRWVRWFSSRGAVNWQPHGWLDYCPLSDARLCEPANSDE